MHRNLTIAALAVACITLAAAADDGMAHMAGHMHMTELRPIQPGDKAKADAIVLAARTAMVPYADYHKALADGYKIFLPDLPQPQYHFTRNDYGLDAAYKFDPAKPTSLLYDKLPDGNYKLVGVMYTDRFAAPESELDQRIPLSIARWHQHTNLCVAGKGEPADYGKPHARFGLEGSITTKDACTAAGGTFLPHLFGWMVHVYPNETDPKKIWSTEDDDQGHDNMDHGTMPGMNMQ